MGEMVIVKYWQAIKTATVVLKSNEKRSPFNSEAYFYKP